MRSPEKPNAGNTHLRVFPATDPSFLLRYDGRYFAGVSAFVVGRVYRGYHVVVTLAVKGLSQQDLDFLLDAKAKTIGALLLHLAGTETCDQMNTFGGMKWGSWFDEAKKSGTLR